MLQWQYRLTLLAPAALRIIKPILVAARCRAALLLASLLLAPSIVQAGWIVLRNGTSIETKGVWVHSETLVAYFDAKTGKANTVPIAFVDLEKSRAATKAGAPPPTPAREKVAITDADVTNWDPEVYRHLQVGDIVGAVKATEADRHAIRCAMLYDDQQARALCRTGQPIPEYHTRAELTPERQKVLEGLDQLDKVIECHDTYQTERHRAACINRVKRGQRP